MRGYYTDRGGEEGGREGGYLYVLINVTKHAETKILIKKHFKLKHFLEICSEQILTHVQNMPSSSGS